MRTAATLPAGREISNFTTLLPWALALSLGGVLALAWLAPPRPPLRSAVVITALTVLLGAALYGIAHWSGVDDGDAAAYGRTWLRPIRELGPRYLGEMTFNAYGAHWLLAIFGLLAVSSATRRRYLAVLAVGAPLLLVQRGGRAPADEASGRVPSPAAAGEGFG